MARMRMVCLGVLLLAACTRQPPLEELKIAEARAELARFYDLFEPDALAARVERIRPHVEAVLGTPLDDPIPIERMSREGYAAWLAERRIRRAGHPDPKERRRIRESTRYAEETFSVLGTVSDHDVRLLPDNFLYAPASKREAVLEAVLAHELVHVHQKRQLGLPDDLGDGEAGSARRAAVEGHAEWVARRVAERLGITDAFDAIVRGPDTAGLTDLEVVTGRLHDLRRQFQYVDGERFFAALAREMGEPRAAKRIFADPPKTYRDILEPARYLAGEPQPEAPDVARIAEKHGTGTSHTWMLLPSAIRLHAGDAVSCVDRAGAMLLDPADGALRAPVRIYVFRCKTEDTARTFAAAVRDRMEHEGDLAIYPDRAWRVVHGDYDSLPDGTFHVARTIRSGLRPSPMQALVLRRGGVVLEIGCPCGPEDTPFLARLANRMLDTLGATQVQGDDRVGALLARARDGWTANATLAELTALLDDPDAEIRATAVVLVRGDDSDKVRQFLARARVHADPAVRKRAVELLGEQDDVDVSGAVADPDATVRCAAVEALAKHDWFESAPAASIDALLADPDARVRAAALDALDGVKDPPNEKIAPLRVDLDPRVRGAAWDAFDGDVTKKDIARALADPDPYVRSEALRSLDEDVEWQAQLLVTALIEDPEPDVRSNAAWHLYLTDVAGLVPRLVEALARPSTRMSVLSVLEKIDAPEAKVALAPYILDPWERTDILEALKSYDPAKPLLEEARRDWDAKVRLEVAVALHGLGDDPEHVIAPALDVLATGYSASCATDALVELAESGELDGHLDRIRAALFAALDNGDETTRAAAIETLLRLDMKDDAVVAAVLVALRDEEQRVASAAVSAVQKLGARASKAVPDLVALLEKPNGDEKVDEDDVADALRAIGPPAKPALPALRALLDHENTRVREAAEYAIEAIEGK